MRGSQMLCDYHAAAIEDPATGPYFVRGGNLRGTAPRTVPDGPGAGAGRPGCAPRIPPRRAGPDPGRTRTRAAPAPCVGRRGDPAPGTRCAARGIEAIRIAIRNAIRGLRAYAVLYESVYVRDISVGSDLVRPARARAAHRGLTHSHIMFIAIRDTAVLL